MFTDEQCTEISRAFDAGNYANAYESNNLEDHDLESMSEHERSAFLLGFFGSYTLVEIGDHREAFDVAYHSPTGRYVVHVAGYTGDRSEEYAQEYAKE